MTMVVKQQAALLHCAGASLRNLLQPTVMRDSNRLPTACLGSILVRQRPEPWGASAGEAIRPLMLIDALQNTHNGRL